MKRNTGCGHGGYDCPPMPKSDVAKSESMGSKVKDLVYPGAPIFEHNVVLKEFELEIPTEAEIKLPSYARDVKVIRKNVHLTQCEAVQEMYNPYKVTLFVEGYVHKNIQYAENSNGYVRDYSVNVPFKSYQVIHLDPPFAANAEESAKDSFYEYRQLAKNGMEADRCKFGSQTWEVFNEPIHCKLPYSQIDQLDISHNFDNWGRFNKLTEKMRVTLVLKLTQKRQFRNGQPFTPVLAANAAKKLTPHQQVDTEENNENS